MKTKVKKKAIKGAIEWFNHGCYPGYTMFIYNYEYEDVLLYLKKIKATGWLKAIQYGSNDIFKTPNQWAAAWREIEDPKTKKKVAFTFIRVPDKFNFTSDDDYVKLAHEVLHICQFFLPPILDRDTELEGEAYFHSHLMEQCLRVMREKTK